MTEIVKINPSEAPLRDWGTGPSGGEHERLTGERPEWHETSSCCGASESGTC
jgi:hypothetical protein